MTEAGHILLADDEEIFLQTTAALLRREGYHCTCAADASTVVQLLEREPCDLLVTDIKMPGNPQLELIQEVARVADGVPVILMTAYPSVDSAVRAIQLPVVAYLVKPFEFAELLLEVRKALAQAGAARAVRGVQQRWQAWGQELEQLAEVARPRSQETAEVTVGALVSFTLRNLAGCLSDLQRLQEALTAGQALRPRSGQALRPRSGQAKHSSENGSDRRDGVPSVHPTLPEDSFELQEMGLNGKQQVRVLPVELRAALQQLSRREREVLRLLLANKRTRTIAKTLFISPQTVRNHLRAIFSKLGVHSQIELLERVGPYRLHEA